MSIYLGRLFLTLCFKTTKITTTRHGLIGYSDWLLMFFVCLFVFLKLSRKLSDKEPTPGKEDAKTSTCTQELDIIQLKFPPLICPCLR